MALFGSFATVRPQAPQTAGFGTAFAYVAELLGGGSAVQQRVRAMTSGAQKFDLGGGVFVIEQVYTTKPRGDGFFESHQQHIDVQVILEGEEVMELADISRMQVRDPFVAERDLVTYQDNPGASLLRARAGDVAIFFPGDVHMPSLQLGAAPAFVRKAVVKIPVS